MKTTILEDLDEYLDYKESYLRSSSYKVYRYFGKLLTEFIVENKLSETPINKFTPAICEQFRRSLIKRYPDPTTRRKQIVLLKNFFAQFTKPGWERYKISPATNLPLTPKQDSDSHEPFTEQQVAEIIGKIIEKKDYYLLLYIYFIHYTFARPGREVRGLKVGDIKERTILIKAEFSKNRRTKTPILTKPLLELLDYMKISNFPKQWYIFGAGGEPGPTPCGSNMYYHRHRQILKELGLADEGNYTLYGWKHTGNIRAVTLGITDRELQQQNGFTESRTLEIYLRRLSAHLPSSIFDKFV